MTVRYSIISKLFVILLMTGFGAHAQKFDFGNGKSVKGYIPVTPATQFNFQSGYGFNKGSVVEAVDREGISDFITAKQPFYFSVLLPEGNYDVKLIMGDTKGISATTVRAECRRLMLENIRTPYGKTTSKTFTVHVKDSVIRGQFPGKVRLKSREHNYLHWDNMLTIEFNDSLLTNKL